MKPPCHEESLFAFRGQEENNSNTVEIFSIKITKLWQTDVTLKEEHAAARKGNYNTDILECCPQLF
jgi:hypothetical protein